MNVYLENKLYPFRNVTSFDVATSVKFLSRINIWWHLALAKALQEKLIILPPQTATMQTWPSVHHKFRKIESVQYLTHSRTKTFITESFEGGYFTYIARNVMLGYGKTQDEQFTMNTEGQN